MSEVVERVGRAMKTAHELRVSEWYAAAGGKPNLCPWEKDRHIWMGRARAAIEAMHEWRLMSDKPTAPISVQYYHGNWPVPPERYNNIRRSLGYWDGLAWRYIGTGHEVFEWPDMTDHHPTHWQELSAPPVTP